MSEVKGYAVRITQNNDLNKIMCQSHIDLIKKYNGAAVASEALPLLDQMKYLGTIIFLKKDEAEGFFRDSANMGIEVLWEKREVFVDDKYFEGGYK